MSFYKEVRSFFQKYDPSRVRLARKIATAYRTPKAQKAAMRRLREVYAAGGPSKFDFSAGKKAIESAAPIVESVVENITDALDDNSIDVPSEAE